MNKQPQTTLEYLVQLESELKKRGVKDINDILADYQDYFTQSKAKGYDDTESMRRLPGVQELAASYEDSNEGAENKQSSAVKAQPSSAQRLTVFSLTLAGDILLLPFVSIAILLLGCFGAVGALLVITGPLLFIPDSMLGQMDVVRLPSLQLLPTALLFILSGTAIMGICLAIGERLYSAVRASIVVRRWLLTGNHSNHLKLIPRVSKRLRALLYRATLIAGIASMLLLLILAIISWFTNGTVNFPSTWKL